MMASPNNNVLYTGVTNDLKRRVCEHKSKLIDGFTKRYNVCKLVYYERTHNINAAIAREKQIKGWTRIKKNALIHEVNPAWNDLFEMFEDQIDNSDN